MIDAGIITEFKCQADVCLRPTREFIKKGPRGTGDLLVIDHIVPRRDKGSHQIQNLRILHNSCNAAWRKGTTGSTHKPNTGAKISAALKQAHKDGRMKKIYTEERSRKLSIANKGKVYSPEVRKRMSDAAKQRWQRERESKENG